MAACLGTLEAWVWEDTPCPLPLPFRLRDRRLGWGLDSTVNVNEPHRPVY